MSRRKAITTLVVALAVALLPGAALADQGNEPAVYLSLGTSLAAGSMADENGNTTPSSDESYTDQLYQRIKGRLAPDLVHVKLGCAGETVAQMTGGTNAYGEPSRCADDYATGSQLGDAIAVLQAQDVQLITIDLGSNDASQGLELCAGDPACIGPAIGQIAQGVAGIVWALRTVGGYDGQIIGMTYYNPQVTTAIGFYPGLPGPLPPDPGLAYVMDQLTQWFNGALAQAYGATGADVADVYAAFNAGDFEDDQPENGIPDNVDVACKLTLMCPDEPGVNANIHLNRKGYKEVAKTFDDVLKGKAG